MTHLARCADCLAILIDPYEMEDERCCQCTKKAAGRVIVWLVVGILTAVLIYGTFGIRALIQWTR